MVTRSSVAGLLADSSPSLSVFGPSQPFIAVCAAPSMAGTDLQSSSKVISAADAHRLLQH